MRWGWHLSAPHPLGMSISSFVLRSRSRDRPFPGRCGDPSARLSSLLHQGRQGCGAHAGTPGAPAWKAEWGVGGVPPSWASCPPPVCLRLHCCDLSACETARTRPPGFVTRGRVLRDIDACSGCTVTRKEARGTCPRPCDAPRPRRASVFRKGGGLVTLGSPAGPFGDRGGRFPFQTALPFLPVGSDDRLPVR